MAEAARKKRVQDRLRADLALGKRIDKEGDVFTRAVKRATTPAPGDRPAGGVSLRGSQQQAFINELTGILGQFASNVSATAGGPPTGAKSVTVVQHNYREKSAFAAMREARLAAAHVL